MNAENDLPAEFDPLYYKSLYSDLADMDDVQAESHFASYGKSEGRQGSPFALRENFLGIVQQQQGSILEIGPFCSPLVTGSNVAYLDVLDATGLRSRAETLGIDPTGCPEFVHFVGSLENVHGQFSTAVSSHAIEHQTDLVRHLEGISRLLEPRGRLYLIIPDKRYCFDARISESTIAGVLQAYREQRTRHTLQSVIEHRALTTHNDASIHWEGASVPDERDDLEQRVSAAIREFDDAGGAYIDVHAWYFTPDSFRRITSTLLALGLTDLEPVRVFNTPRNRLEFCAVLEKKP